MFGWKIWCITGRHDLPEVSSSHCSTLSQQELPVPLLFESQPLDVSFRLVGVQFKSQDYTCASLSGALWCRCKNIRERLIEPAIDLLYSRREGIKQAGMMPQTQPPRWFLLSWHTCTSIYLVFSPSFCFSFSNFRRFFWQACSSLLLLLLLELSSELSEGRYLSAIESFLFICKQRQEDSLTLNDSPHILWHMSVPFAYTCVSNKKFTFKWNWINITLYQIDKHLSLLKNWYQVIKTFSGVIFCLVVCYASSLLRCLKTLPSPATGKSNLPVLRASGYTKCKDQQLPFVSTLGLTAQQLSGADS